MAENQIKIPQFWESIEKSHLLDVDGISEIKEILTILKYTTADSIVQFEKRKAIQAIELEFCNKKSEIVQKYPHLGNFCFASGVYSILASIASKIKKTEYQDIDTNQIVEKVFNDVKQVCNFEIFFVLYSWFWSDIGDFGLFLSSRISQRI